MPIADFSELDRESARSVTDGWLWRVGNLWTACAGDVRMVRDKTGDLAPELGVPNWLVQAALRSGEWVVALVNGMDEDRPPCAVRKAGTPKEPVPFLDWNEVERLRWERMN